MLESVNSKSKLLLLKYLLITGTVSALGIILLSAIMLLIIGESNRGYAIGMAIGPKEKSMMALQIISTLSIAYFIGPRTVNAIHQGQSGTYVGIESLFICWTAPWILLTLIFAIPNISWEVILINGIIAIIPALVIGPLVGRVLKKKIMK